MKRRDISPEAVTYLMCARIGAAYAPPAEKDAGWSRKAARLEAVGDLQRGARGWLDYLLVRPSGNFGNNFIQLLHALIIAEAAGVPRVRHPFEWFGGGGLDHQLRLVNRARARKDRAGLRGAFFQRRHIETVNDAPPERFLRIIEDYLVPSFALTPRSVAPICVNLRGGADIFENPKPNARYGQPPLSYYKTALKRLFATYGEAPVVIVHQDDRNPVLAPLAMWLEDQGASFTLASGGPEADAQAILGARHLVMGWTTFTTALALLSPNVESVTVFRDVQLKSILSLKAKALFLVEDVMRSYTPPGGWANTPAQREAMLTYPEQALKVREIAREADPASGLDADRRLGRTWRRATRRRRRLARIGLLSPNGGFKSG